MTFLKMCWTVPVVKQGSIKMMLAHQYHNAVAILNIFVLYFMVNTLSEFTDDDDDTNKRNKAKALMTLYALLWLVPFTIKHYLDYSKCYWKVGGGLRKHLQILLLKMFLNYDEASRSKVAVEKVVMAMVRDVVDAVSEAYIVSIDLVFGSIVKLVLLITSMLVLQSISSSDGSIEPSNVVPPISAILCLPVFIFAFLKVRASKGFDLRQHQFDAENNLVDHVIRTVLNYQLVADYDRRTFEVEKYQGFINAFNKASVAYAAFTVNSKYFVPWLTTVLVASWMVYGGSSVIDGNILLSTYLSTITIFRLAGGEFEKSYQLQLRITSAYASIAQVTQYLNLPIDVPTRRVFSRKRRAFGRQMRQETRASLAGGKLSYDPTLLAVDRLPIKMVNVSFSYKTADSTRNPESILSNMALEFPQGKLVEMRGAAGGGKATVLKLLADAVFPTDPAQETLVFTPPHLRCVQVQENPLVLGPHETILENMTYGIKKSPSIDWAALEERSRIILKRLGMADHIMESFKTPGFLGVNGVCITRADRQLINLGRAFLMNPEMIIMHKPAALLNEKQAKLCLAMMREFVDNRGVLMDPAEPIVMRRKRTLLFTTLIPSVAEVADEIYFISDNMLTKENPDLSTSPV
uniref:ABC transporter domain-containing protein n=2 Tax=Octactis speculum TaxID=3111310 RepID=A0A7S2FH94_9STRA|mmetsp:Transcript_21852/g.29729  ORF Transcript_21852/g.29729 Transcript_21852/m.29729 type:complete len:634 (+) Transcript_21852:646-2547(+)